MKGASSSKLNERVRNFSEVTDESKDLVADVDISKLQSVSGDIAKQKKPQPKPEQVFAVSASDEGLGDDFESTPWRPPSIDLAKDFKARHVYRSGNTPLKKIKLTGAADLGTGVSLYFQFAKSASICMFVMTFLAAPSLLFSFFGSRIPEQDRDLIGLYRLTIGNIGYDPSSLTYSNDSACHHTGFLKDLTPLSYNGTCIHVMDYEFTMPQVALALSASEVLQILAFFCFIWHLKKKTDTLKTQTERQECTISDYTVMIRGFPKDTTTEQLITHFSALYPLDAPDWRKRPPIEGAMTVMNTDNSLNQLYLGTWVAEVTIHRAIGRYIRTFKDKQSLMEQLYFYRAKMKMYAEGTPHASGANFSWWKKAEKNMKRIASKIDSMTRNIVKKKKVTKKPVQQTNKIAAIDAETEAMENGQGPGPGIGGGAAAAGPGPGPGQATNKSSSNKQQQAAAMPTSSSSQKLPPAAASSANIDVADAMEADAIAAFITFEYTESFARCVEDYSSYNSRGLLLPPVLYYPSKLKFRGRRLHVIKAPEPDEIVWENLETGSTTRFLHRVRTSIITIILMAVCFAITLQASIYKQQFSDAIPDSSTCLQTIPMLYASTGNGTTDYNQISIIRAPAALRTADDASCAKVIPGSIYGIYALNGNIAHPVGEYSFDVCKKSLADANGYSDYGLCPHYDQEVFCPCLSPSSTEVCNSIQCTTTTTTSSSTSTSTATDGTCTTFPADSIFACYCNAELSNLIQSGSVIQAMQIALMSSGDPCGEYFRVYTTAQGLIYGTIIFATVVNHFLLRFLKYLTRWESHSSINKEQRSMMLKIFLSLYFNMTWIALIAFGRIDNLPSLVSYAHIFEGYNSDFTTTWYSSVGVYFLTSFIVQSASPLITAYVSYWVIKPFIRAMYYPFIGKYSSHSIVMQHQVNVMELGPVFDPTVSAAQLLALLFFAMTYGTGLPGMMPAAFMTFALFFYTDKMLLCRFYQQPPHISEGAIRIVLTCLPWAAVIRLAIGAWMLSYPGLLGPGVLEFKLSLMGYQVSSREYLYELSRLQYHWGGESSSYAFLETRGYRANVFPLVILMIIIVLVRIIRFVFKRLPFRSIKKAVKRLFTLCARNRKSIYIIGKNGFVRSFDLMKLKHPLRQEAAPFTGPYFRFVRDNNAARGSRVLAALRCARKAADITDQELAEGWELAEQGGFIVKVKAWDKVVHMAGITRMRGERKRTFEVIMEHSCQSYSTEKLPAYRLAIQGLKEGAAALMEHASNSCETGKVTAADLLLSVADRDSLLDKYSKMSAERKRKNDPIWARELEDDTKKDMTTDEKTNLAMSTFYNAGRMRENDPDDIDLDEDDDEDGDDDDDSDEGDDDEEEEEEESDEERLV